MEQLKNIINETNKISSQTQVWTFQKYFGLFIEGIFLVRMQYVQQFYQMTQQITIIYFNLFVQNLIFSFLKNNDGIFSCSGYCRLNWSFWQFFLYLFLLKKTELEKFPPLNAKHGGGRAGLHHRSHPTLCHSTTGSKVRRKVAKLM